MDFAQVPCKADEQEIARLMAQYGSSIKRSCYLILKDKALCEDAAQETFVKVWKHLDDLKTLQNEKAWLMRIAMNTCRDMLRGSWFRFLDRRVTPEELPLASEPDDPHPLLAEAILALAARYRQVVVLYYYQGMNTQEMAHALRLSVNTVKSRLTRARKLLKDQLEGGWNHD